MKKMSVVDHIISGIHDAIAEYKRKYGKDPKYLLLSIDQQQAIRVQTAYAQRMDPFEVSEVSEYMGIPVIDEEDVVIAYAPKLIRLLFGDPMLSENAKKRNSGRM